MTNYILKNLRTVLLNLGVLSGIHLWFRPGETKTINENTFTIFSFEILRAVEVGFITIDKVEDERKLKKHKDNENIRSIKE
jgi:hypothetical protein